MHYLTIPGLHNSGPQHWQTLWENSCPQQFTRLQQKNWTNPLKDDWVNELNTCAQHTGTGLILVAHSLGAITVAHWASAYSPAYIAGALLVAPADTENTQQECFKTFCPVPKNKFPFPSVVVASTNDPYCSIEKAARWSAYWGSKFICVGDKGHINAASGLGDWQEGFSVLAALTANIKKSFIPL